MTIEAKLKKLVENEIKASTKVKLAEGLEDLENCSDAELIKYAKQMGLEDSIVLDGEGGLSNRDEVIQAINNVDASSNELEEDAEEVDEAPRKMSPAKAKAFLQSIDALGKDFFTLRSETVTKIVDYAREVGYRKSPSAPGSTGRMFFYYLDRLASKAPQGVEQEVENESVEDENMDTLIPEAAATIDGKKDGRYQINKEFTGSDNNGKPMFVVRFSGDFIGSAKTQEEAKDIAQDHAEKRMQKDIDSINSVNEDISLIEAEKDEFEEMDLPETGEEGTDEPLDLDKDSDLEQDETEEEPEKITVVVVSPDLKKDEADEEDELDSSYELPDGEEGKKGKLINTKEHIDALHEGEELSEEFKEKAKVIFEAALRQQSEVTRKRFIREFNLRKVRMQKDFDKKLKDIKEALIKEQAALVDGYLSEAVDTWIAENEVTLESNVRTELTEEFIDGLKHLFTEHYIEVPQEKFDLVKAQEDKIKQLEESVETYKQSSLRNLKEAKKLHCESVIAKATSNMTELDKVKFIKLVESVEFDSIKQFESKVKTLKESYMTKTNSPKKQVQENRSKKIVTETRTENNTVTMADAVSDFLDKTVL